MSDLTINVDKIKSIALMGVKRAATFLALGVNAARNPDFKEYRLSQLASFQVFPDNIGDEQISLMKSEFEYWIIGNGLRELVELFGIYLDRMHHACLLIAVNQETYHPDRADNFKARFEYDGLKKKLSTLRGKFGVQTEKEGYLVSINQARNCLTHRFGRVGEEDVDENGTLRLLWWALDLYLLSLNGQKKSVSLPIPAEPIITKEGDQFVVEVVDRTREYNLGDMIRLNPAELSEICLLFQLATNELAISFVDYCRESGIEMKDVPKGSES
jgi:hypothetical protein